MIKRFFKNKAVVVTAVIIALLLTASLLLTFVFEGSSAVHRAARVVVSPFQKGVTAVKNSVSDFFAAHTRYDALKAENDALRARIADMERTVRDAGMYKDENDSLRALLDMRQRNRDLKIETATLIAWSDTAWRSVFTLNKGSSSGFAVGNAVITGDGLVGQIVSVTEGTCEVASVLDMKAGAGVIVTRNRLACVTEGSLELMAKKQLRLSGLPRGADITPGDTVETSGLGGLLPPGLLVGTVSSVASEQHGMGTYASVDPAANIESLQQVFVVTDFTVDD